MRGKGRKVKKRKQRKDREEIGIKGDSEPLRSPVAS